MGDDDGLADSRESSLYRRLNQQLGEHGFDDFVETQCAGFYAETMGRPGLPPGIYFRLLLIGYFEGLNAERAIAWRAADSFALREFLGLVLPEAPPDHSTISRTRRLIDVETHEAVFRWILQRVADAGLLKGKTVGIDATTLEANAALRSFVRRDTGESYHDFLTKLAQASGIETPTRADIATESSRCTPRRRRGPRGLILRLASIGHRRQKSLRRRSRRHASSLRHVAAAHDGGPIDRRYRRWVGTAP